MTYLSISSVFFENLVMCIFCAMSFTFYHFLSGVDQYGSYCQLSEYDGAPLVGLRECGFPY